MDYIISTEYDGKPRKLFPMICKICGKVFYAPCHKKRLICGIACAVKHRHKGKRVLDNCSYCGVQFERRTSRVSKTGLYFCSRICKDTAQRLENFGHILRPKCDGEFSYRDVAFRHYTSTCNRCGYNKYQSVLRVHHIDRDRTNNEVTNLEVLCPTCHEEEHYLKGDGVYTGWKRKNGGMV